MAKAGILIMATLEPMMLENNVTVQFLPEAVETFTAIMRYGSL